MAQVAVIESSSNSLTFGTSKPVMTMKRKTPSELRSEQLKRSSQKVTKILPPLPNSDSGKIDEIKRCEQVKVSKYINTRVNEIYPVRKSSERCRVLYGDEKEFTIVSGSSSGIPAAVSSVPTEGKISTLCENASILNKSERTGQSARDMSDKGFKKITKCNQNELRSVVDLHRGDENLATFAKIDMEKALKRLVACDIPATSSSLLVHNGKVGDRRSNSSSNFCSEFEMAGPRIPFDFTLKTSQRFVSSSSLKWCHQLNATATSIDIFTNPYRFDCVSAQSDSAKVNFSRSLHSWVYPQSSLPSQVVSIMASSTAKEETDFLLKRVQDWEDSFRDLYYRLRKDMCKIFYVYTMQFVVLFVGGKFLEKKKHSCNAYLSQSTRGLRSLLRKHSVSFTMPLCRVEVEQATEEDLVELMEIKKRNLGQVFHTDALSNVDNTSQSLLLFSGNREVHALYDFLLNYRFFLNSLAGSDVPMLYAPIHFKNATSHTPEVRYKETRKADMVISSSSGSDTDDIGTFSGSSLGALCYCIEIKDTILPPWVVCGVSAAMSSEGRSFLSTFNTDSMSVGLNAALNSICCEKDVSSVDVFGITEAVFTPRLSGTILHSLKYSDGVYTANLTPI